MANPPLNAEEILNTSLWWTTRFVGENFGFTKLRAHTLALRGMQCLRDLCQEDSMTPRPWGELQPAFNLRDDERPLIDRYYNNIPRAWSGLFHETSALPLPNKWLGLFRAAITEDPFLVFQVTDSFHPSLLPASLVVTIHVGHPRFSIGG